MPKSEKRDLWIVVGIILSLAVYHLWSNVSGFVNVTVPYIGIPLSAVITNMLFFWTVAALWVAYNRWTEAAAHEQEFRDILESTGPAAVIFVDAEGRIEDCSESVEVMLGYEKANVLMKSLDKLFEMDKEEGSEEGGAEEAIEKLGFHVGEGVGRRSDGTELPVEMIRLARKTTGGTFILLHDIKARKEDEQHLRDAVEQAEKATQTQAEKLERARESYEQAMEVETLRENLLQMAIRDLTRPLQAAKSGCDALGPSITDELDEAKREELCDVAEHIRRSAMMVQSVVDVRRFEAGGMEVAGTRGAIVQTVQEVVDGFGKLSRTRSVKVEVEPDVGWAMYDLDMARRVIEILVDNALRHTPESGEVLIRIGLDRDFVRVSVTDQGPRIPASMRSKIFGAYNLLNMPGKSPRRPRGLCLAYCKMAIDANGGELGADAGDTTGMTFWFSLPCLHAAATGG